jgi:hypothetical protein
LFEPAAREYGTFITKSGCVVFNGRAVPHEAFAAIIGFWPILFTASAAARLLSLVCAAKPAVHSAWGNQLCSYSIHIASHIHFIVSYHILIAVSINSNE